VKDGQAIGVGAGNGPAYIHHTADVRLAVKRILDSKTFDNGTICASEQSIVVERRMEGAVTAELKAQGAYLLDDEEHRLLSKFILRPNGTMNPAIVGKSVETVAKLAGLTRVPPTARVLVARETGVGPGYPYSNEKLGLILAYYVEDSEEAVLRRCVEILEWEGAGHTFAIHTEDADTAKRFAATVPASRVLVNTPAALGGIGATTCLFPALTLGCGAVGGSSSSNNIGPLDLINIKRVAWGVKELEELRGNRPAAGYAPCAVDESLLNELVNRIIGRLSV
jgi:acyl-CoA reductase-like NAD-dependent aldehyde dehydrogenase